MNQDTVEEARRVAPLSNISPTGPDLANLQDPQQSDLLTTQARLLQGCEQRPGLANLQDSVRSGLSNITQTIETKQVLFNFCEEDDGIDVIPEPNAEPVVSNSPWYLLYFTVRLSALNSPNTTACGSEPWQFLEKPLFGK